MPVTLRLATLFLVCLIAAPFAAQAQDEPDPSETARFRAGALRFTPSIVLSNLGFDNNVFNEEQDPKRDTTAAIGPGIDLWLKAGPSRLSGKASGQYLYFNKYDSQRSWNTNAEGRWELPLSRISPYVGGLTSNTKDRPGFEIDSRVRLRRHQLGLGTLVRLSGKTSVVLGAEKGDLRYDRNDLFLADQIARTLDRNVTTETAQLRVRLTPLTAFVVRSEAQQDRFITETDRDANSIKVMPGFDLRPEALISGRVFVGVRRFNALRNDVPDFTGVAADVEATYIRNATQFQLRVSRDLLYSYELLQPYYAQIDSGLAVTQRVSRHWDLVGRADWQSLQYQNLVSSQLAERTDHSWRFGSSLGYRIAETLRVGLDANYYRRRTAALILRNYEGLRVGASFSYGLNP